MDFLNENESKKKMVFEKKANFENKQKELEEKIAVFFQESKTDVDFFIKELEAKDNNYRNLFLKNQQLLLENGALRIENQGYLEEKEQILNENGILEEKHYKIIEEKEKLLKEMESMGEEKEKLLKEMESMGQELIKIKNMYSSNYDEILQLRLKHKEESDKHIKIKKDILKEKEELEETIKE